VSLEAPSARISSDVTTYPIIDYRAHPAYAPMAPPYIYDDQLIAHSVAGIDAAFRHLCQLPGPSLADADRATSAFQDGARAILLHARDVGAPIVAREWLGSCVEWAVADLRYECLRLVYLDRSDCESRLSRAQQAQLANLRANGMYLAEVDDHVLREVKRFALRFAPELRDRISANPSDRAVYSPSRISPLGRAIQKLLSTAGVLDVLSVFKRTKMAVMGTGLEYSRPGQIWHAGLYSDVGLADGPLKYFHVDQADHLPKAMIYATAVRAENGPTGVIRESNTWARSEFLFRAHKGLDRVTIGRYGKYVDAEYRASARTPELRRIFMQLPSAFQGSSHFGDDVLPDSPLADRLLAREETFLSAESGYVMVFDGGRTLHRGSVVREGERVALQVAFKNLGDRRITAQLQGGTALRKFVRRVRTLAAMSVRG
jgi:hypothetical protein